VCVLVLCACPRAPEAPLDAGAPEPDAGTCTCASPGVVQPPPSRPHTEPTAAAPHVEPLAVCEAKGRLPLQAAREYADAAQWEKALSCAAQASALTPNDVLAHTERANALSALGRADEARVAYARALAIDPESLDALLGAAHFYTVALPSTREHDELGSLYAERGFELAQGEKEEDTAIQFARLSAMAFNDVGQGQDAIERASWVLAKKPSDPEALYEKAFALFELCRFAEAKAVFTALLKDPQREAHAREHLGLIAEREGRLEDAQAFFARAQKLDPETYPPPQLLSAAEFRAEVDRILGELPVDMREDIAQVPFDVEDIPQLADLTADEPSLSPTILGLFRGPPLQESCAGFDAGAGHPCRSVVLYRKNLARAVRSHDELIEQIRVTLLHEIGHLRGEDDFELAARGLE
jgi:tetratricopeptide (TPR) repeat protein